MAQIEINDQPGSAWYEMVWAKHQQCMLTKNQLLAVKRDFNLPDFQDTLRHYDWIDLGGYLFVDKEMTSGYGEQRSSYKITRLDEGDTVLDFTYTATYNAMDQGTITHTNFSVTMFTNAVWQVKQIGTKWFIYDTNNREYLHLIHYSNWLLIYDTPMNGKSSDTRFFSRRILMAVPRAFSWSKISN